MSVLKWPDLSTVNQAVRTWAEKEVERHPELWKLGYFGSYARGDWGVGSDLDLIAIVHQSSESFERRALSWNLTHMPVPSEIIVYTKNEWQKLHKSGGRFIHTLEREVIWIYPRSS